MAQQSKIIEIGALDNFSYQTLKISGVKGLFRILLNSIRHQSFSPLQNQQLHLDLVFVSEYLNSLVVKDDEIYTVGFYSLIMEKLNERKESQSLIKTGGELDEKITKKKKLLKYYDI